MKMFITLEPGLQIRVHSKNNGYLISQSKHMLWVFKRTVLMNFSSFETMMCP